MASKIRSGSKPINASEEALPILDKHNKKAKTPNIDVELFIKNGNPPKYIFWPVIKLLLSLIKKSMTFSTSSNFPNLEIVWLSNNLSILFFPNNKE